MVSVSRNGKNQTNSLKRTTHKKKPTRKNPPRNLAPRQLRSSIQNEAVKQDNVQSQRKVSTKLKKNLAKKVNVEATFEVSDAVIDQILARKKRSSEETIILGKFLVINAKNKKFVSDPRNRQVEWVVQKKPKRMIKEEPADRVNENQIRRDMPLQQSIKDRMKIRLQKRAVKVQSDEMKYFIRAEENYRKKISSDPVLCEIRRSFRLALPEPLLNFVANIMEIKVSRRTDQAGEVVEPAHAKHATKFAYTPPSERVLVMENLTKNPKNVIPVYSDIAGGDVTKLVIPETLFYKYVERNLINDQVHAMERAFRTSTEAIKCDCCSNGKTVVPCWANPDCKCGKVARALSKKKEKLIGPFAPTNPEYLNYYKALDFSCSGLCGCKGNCTNNSLVTLDKHLYQLEVYQRDAIMGNSIRTLNAIPAGAVVSEFVGDLIPESEFQDEDSDFSYTVIHGSEKITKKLKTLLGNSEKKQGILQWSEEKWMEHEVLMKENWILNPKWFGNISRTYGHSCAPNLMPVRVFQKGFLPTQVRMVLVAIRDIFPGTELSIDYGKNYLEGALENNCLCGTLPCSSSGLPALNKEGKKVCVMIEHASGLALLEDISKAVDKRH